MNPLTERHSASPYRAAALAAGADPAHLDRVIGLLPLMLTGYEASRLDLAWALALLHPPRATTPRPATPGPATIDTGSAERAATGAGATLARLGWTSAERAELTTGLARLLTDPRTPEEWVAHDTVAAALRLRDVGWITPMGVHTGGELEPLTDPPPPVPAARRAVLAELAELILSRAGDHPLRIGLDGGTCAGKSTLGDELADEFRRRGVWAVRACADFFKLSPEQRTRDDLGSVYDRPTLRRELLEPLGPGGNRLVRTASWDGWTRRSLLDRPPSAVPEDGVAVVDGSMMLTAPDLAGLLDFRIWVRAGLDTRRERMVTRDLLWTEDPSPDTMRRKFDTRYAPVEEKYRIESGVETIVDVVVDNEDPLRPTLIIPAR